MLLLLDLDGTVWRGAEPVPGVPALLAARVARGDTVVYVTNNSLHHRAAYVPRLRALGAPVTIEHVVTSARATALYVAGLAPRVERVLVVGSDGLVAELREVGLAVVTAGEAGPAYRSGAAAMDAAGGPGAVVAGLDRSIDYDRLAVAAACIRAGATFVASNRDPVFPTERGLEPGAGSIVAALEAASGVVPVSLGKPEPLLLEEAARAAQLPLADAVLIGDSLLTDIAAARAAGIRSVLMLTGVARPEHLAALEPGARPTAVAADAAELARVLDALEG
jgi:phosphoglycolate/pyridoxal phosphate phosphatase family enzyme